jgi:hypothetical protein
MAETFDPDKLLADARSRSRRADERVEAALARLGGTRARSSRSLDDLTAEEIERDTASIYRILAAWRQIGKRHPSPIRLPSGRTVTPKSCEAGTARGGLESRPRRKGRVRP